MFPFGFGLTYSRFAFSALAVSPRLAAGAGPVSVSATVTNTGNRTASDVAQLYVGDPASAGEPPRQLKGFQRVTLAPGRSQRVTFSVAASDLQTWDSTAHAWTTNPGRYGIFVGDSSRNLPLTSTYTLATSAGARKMTTQAPATLDPAHANVVTTTLTAGGTQPLTSVRLGLDVPAGWTAKATTASRYPIVLPGTQLRTSWLVTPPAGAQSRLWRLVATASAGGGYSTSGGAQVSVGPIVAATLTSTTKSARTGTSFAVTATLRNTTDQPVSVADQITGATGLTVTPARSTVVLPARTTVTTPLTVEVAAKARSASLDLTGTVTIAGQDYALPDGPLDLPVLFGSLADAYDNTAVSDDASPGSADFDGSGFSYSAQSLADAGLVPGRPVVHGSTTFTWPAPTAGNPDNVVAAGQEIAVGKSGSTLSFLGSASNGSGSGTGTITYTDGSTAPFTLALTNWTPGAVLPADQVVATAATWNRPPNSGYPATIAVSVYTTSVPLAAAKTVASVTLPTTVTGDQAGTRLHVFDLVVS